MCVYSRWISGGCLLIGAKVRRIYSRFLSCLPKCTHSYSTGLKWIKWRYTTQQFRFFFPFPMISFISYHSLLFRIEFLAPTKNKSISHVMKHEHILFFMFVLLVLLPFLYRTPSGCSENGGRFFANSYLKNLYIDWSEIDTLTFLAIDRH